MPLRTSCETYWLWQSDRTVRICASIYDNFAIYLFAVLIQVVGGLTACIPYGHVIRFDMRPLQDVYILACESTEPMKLTWIPRVLSLLYSQILLKHVSVDAKTVDAGTRTVHHRSKHNGDVLTTAIIQIVVMPFAGCAVLVWIIT